jgi:hypothetical protein
MQADCQIIPFPGVTRPPVPSDETEFARMERYFARQLDHLIAQLIASGAPWPDHPPKPPGGRRFRLAA